MLLEMMTYDFEFTVSFKFGTFRLGEVAESEVAEYVAERVVLVKSCGFFFSLVWSGLGLDVRIHR